MFFDEERSVKRTLGIRDKQILYRNAKGRCQNPGCNKKIDFDEMQVGHKTAYSRGGATTMRNSVCLCYRCNKLQGTDSWATFLKKQNIEDPETVKKQSMKQALQSLSLAQLKSLAGRHHVKILGQVEEDWFESHRVAPTKSQYVTKLTGVVTSAELASLSKETPVRAKPKKRRTSDRS
ncbi:MAG: HNH endonuclease [Chloroflexi bacterium]|nr:HNH endonuclease [Chloroflexota bacterium]